LAFSDRDQVDVLFRVVALVRVRLGVGVDRLRVRDLQVPRARFALGDFESKRGQCAGTQLLQQRFVGQLAEVFCQICFGNFHGWLSRSVRGG